MEQNEVKKPQGRRSWRIRRPPASFPPAEIDARRAGILLSDTGPRQLGFLTSTTMSTVRWPRRSDTCARCPVIVYAVVDDALSPDFPLGVELTVLSAARMRSGSSRRSDATGESMHRRGEISIGRDG